MYIHVPVYIYCEQQCVLVYKCMCVYVQERFVQQLQETAELIKTSGLTAGNSLSKILRNLHALDISACNSARYQNF